MGSGCGHDSHDATVRRVRKGRQRPERPPFPLVFPPFRAWGNDAEQPIHPFGYASTDLDQAGVSACGRSGTAWLAAGGRGVARAMPGDPRRSGFRRLGSERENSARSDSVAGTAPPPGCSTTVNSCCISPRSPVRRSGRPGTGPGTTTARHATWWSSFGGRRGTWARTPDGGSRYGPTSVAADTPRRSSTASHRDGRRAATARYRTSTRSGPRARGTPQRLLLLAVARGRRRPASRLRAQRGRDHRGLRSEIQVALDLGEQREEPWS